jgi:multicomponent Na+:H+ antiporter subunit D
MAGNLPSRQFKELKHTPLPFMVGVSVTVASLSISGLPLLMGFGAKAYSVDNLLPWQDWLMNIAAVGTAISFAKFIFLPWQPFDPTLTKEKAMAKGFWPAIIILLASLFLGNLFYWEAYKLSNIIKAIVTILIGWFLYGAFIKKLAIKLPRWGEQLNDLVGMMSIILTLLIWWVVQP